MTDNDAIRLRRELRTVLAQSWARMIAAAELLEHKAKASPNTAEAKAHQLIVEARDRLTKWMEDAGADLLRPGGAPSNPTRAAAIAGVST